MADQTIPRFNSKEQASVVPFFFMHEGEECVKVQIAGETRFAPTFRVNDLWIRDGLEEITYSQRWPDQYAQFKAGSAQVADGTPLEEAPFLNPSRIADLRQLKIYSVEALANLDDRNIPRLSGKGYELKQLARSFLERRLSDGANGQIAILQAQVAELMAKLVSQPVNVAAASEPDLYADKTDDDLKAMIADLHGQRPRGNPNRATLLQMLSAD